MMVRRLALLLLLPGALVAMMLTTAAPASAFVVHGFAPDDWGLRSYDCSGAPDDGTAYDLEETDLHTLGVGSLRVSTGPDSVGGALVTYWKYLRAMTYRVYGVSGDDPHARWHVEINAHVLESDPIPISHGAWTKLALGTATLHEGDWSGTIDDWIALHHYPDTWTAGLLTGGCLGSPEAQIDQPRAKGIGYDLEPSDWTTFTLVVPPRQLSRYYPVYGDTVDLAATVRHTDLRTGKTTRVQGADVDLSRRYGHQPWTSVETTSTDETGNLTFTRQSLRTTDYRMRVEKAGFSTSTAELHVPTFLGLPRPRINGEPCKPFETSRDTCAEQHVNSGAFTLSGRLIPGGTVVARIELDRATHNRHRTKEVPVDEHGHWQVTFHLHSGLRYFWIIHGEPTSKRYATSRFAAADVDVR